MNLRGRNKVSAEFNMSSMTDIVFLLLIFFMLTSTMVTTNALDLVLPKAKGKTDSNKNIAVSINKKLEFFIDKEPVPETELESRLLSLFTSDKDKAIILRAEEGVPIEKAVNVLDIANRNQIKVVLAVRPK
ncbi:MAG TPA: biopolymer transporter ExbD [Flavobacterium sp.]|jgi:biopolymer transport protein ExbD|uniref:ExbD/TolR family protein n=1 Tax=Flavobacterium sp. TaxID=239 RepID=UPI001B7A6EF7|nr:biopolymer transporter ExbD [Flavobacterium sp.]MBP6147176.1 biopolymer transporter ExbD [Flavobacterium sp.]MBP7183673.1 biopolymer transporter ExbD [Flavobacterium sp.]MBP7319024.1 biopolymer transporter ExbD [Flavobacterium sp.]MBP8886532.1 biopolymer transporter ExbD [Flavobacterium sp.]HRL72038.1 biopolymer transporter ExbD [Flavobacterium sp.]